MNDSLGLSAAAVPRPSARPRPTFAPVFELRADDALTVLGFAAAVGGVGDILIHGGPTGMGFPTLIAVAVAAFIALLWRLERALAREPTLWLATAILFAAAVAWREADTLQFLNACAAIFSLLMAVVCVRDGSSGLFARRLRDSLASFVSALRNAAVGILPLAFREALSRPQSGRRSGRARQFIRAGLISGGVVLVFGALLRSADPIFASLTSLGAIDLGAVASHAVLIVVLTSLAAGAARSALLPALMHDGSSSFEARLEQSDVTAALVTLNILFGAFVLAQLGWFFGGDEFLRARTGLTAAQYAREGFFQMAFIVALVLPLLVAARAALPAGRSTDKRFASLAFPVVVLLGAIILSAALRMRLYVSYFGLSTDRFDTLAFMAWLAIVLVWFSLTVLRGWSRPFAAGAVVSGLVVLAALDVAAPDAIVARANTSRVTGSGMAPTVDFKYLASLGGESAPVAVQAVLSHPAAPTAAARQDVDRSNHCSAVSELLHRWGPGSSAEARSNSLVTWRTWNAGEHRAVEAVGARYGALLRMHTICNSRT